MTLSDYLSLFPGASREKPRFMAPAEGGGSLVITVNARA